MQANEFILPREHVRHITGILVTIAKEKEEHEHSPSSPCKRCLVFFEGKGRQAADTDPFPSRVGLLCASYPFLISAYLFSPSDLVQKQYIVEQFVIQ